MADPIDFYFDFSSPYGYLAAQSVDVLAARAGRGVTWRPFLLGAVFKTTGSQPLVEIPLKGDYALRDMHRAARWLGVPFQMPESFPFASIAACRAFYALVDDHPDRAKALALALYRRAFGEGGEITSPEQVIAVAGEIGLDQQALAAALQDTALKARLRREVEAAVAAGVFGSPFFVADGEPFWGHDRLDHLEEWLKKGGW